MKHLPHLTLGLIIAILFFIPGCSRYLGWLSDVFHQGCEQPTYICEAQRFIRSVRIYDQFKTLGNFDGLWLNRPVREAYVNAYAITKCLTDAQWDMLVEQQESQERHYIMFYLLATTSDEELLTDKCSEWNIQLMIDGCCFTSVELKTVELCTEYRRFFGPWFNIFKKQYLIKFNAVDEAGVRLINSNTKVVQLVFRRLGKETYMTWCLDASGMIIDDQSFNKDILAYDLDTNT